MASIKDTNKGKKGHDKGDFDFPSELDSSKRVAKKILGSPTYLTSAAINAKCKEAVVDVEGISVLVAGTFTPPTPGVPDSGSFTPVPSGGEGTPPLSFLYRVCGSGFFTDCRYILTAASNVIIPFTSPTSLPSDITFDSTTVDATNFVYMREPLPDFNAQIVRANRVYVRVYNVNGTNCSYLYEAVVVGVDGAANVAVLRIDENLIFNKDKPCLEKAVFLKWGKSCLYPTGSAVYNIANSNQSTLKFSAGVLRDNRDVDVRFKYYESVDTDIPFFSGQVGSPIIDANGNVIGVGTGRTSDIHDEQLTNFLTQKGLGGATFIDGTISTSQGLVPQEQSGNDFGAGNQFTLNPAAAAEVGGGFFGGTVGNVPPNFPLNNGGPFEGLPLTAEGTPLPVTPSLQGTTGDINRVKGAQEAVRGILFGVAQNIAKRIARTFIKADQGSCTKRVDIQEDLAGNFFIYRKGWFNVHVELVTTNSWLNHNLSVSPDTKTSQVSVTSPTFGVRVPFSSELSGYFVRCINSASPLAGILKPGDIITEIACQKLGANGVGFYSILWKFKPGDTVRLTYFKNSDNYATANCALVRLETIALDFPLETVGILQLFIPTVFFGYDPTPLCGPADLTTDFFDGFSITSGIASDNGPFGTPFVSGGLGAPGDNTNTAQ